ncbi:hypothetical protein BJX66DRAFT_299088 [Aspergillus keveii]|uniref:Uncharacterized protein n=1 Tax=Aspergillus keveii TaxID=714993 RepID=A0ABR4GCC4_9EURO
MKLPCSGGSLGSPPTNHNKRSVSGSDSGRPERLESLWRARDLPYPPVAPSFQGSLGNPKSPNIVSPQGIKYHTLGATAQTSCGENDFFRS